jgi:hypothetical protein
MTVDFNAVKIYIRPGPTDLRKAVNGLTVLVQEQMRLDLLSGNVYVFCNKGRKLLKAVWWDRAGFWLAQKWLEEARFPWPDDNRAAAELDAEQVRMLLEGIDFFRLISRCCINGLVKKRPKGFTSFACRNSITAMEKAPAASEAIKKYIMRLEHNIVEFEKKVIELERNNKTLEQENSGLQEKLKLALFLKFGRHAKKFIGERQPLLFAAVERAVSAPKRDSEATVTVAGHTRKQVGLKPLDEKIPRKDEIIDITEEDKQCA